MPWKTGFFDHNFRDRFPRGIRRVARAIVESLAPMDHGLETLCLTKKITNSRPVTYSQLPLQEWLDEYPLNLSLATLQQGRSFSWKKIIKSVLPPVFLPPVKWVWQKFKRLREIIGAPPSSDALEQTAAGKNARIALEELDAFVAFEPFDQVWSLPLENYPCLALGWFFDAVPKRLNEGENWNPEFFEAAVSRMALRARHIFCDSHSAEADLCHFYPTALGKTSVIHLGHDLERFTQPRKQELFQKSLGRLGVRQDLPYFLFVGTVEPRKNVAGILKATQFLKRTRPDRPFQLVLAGQIPGQAELRQFIKQTAQALPLVATDYLPDQEITTLLQGAAGFVYPSLWEGFGIPNLEAMSAGTLVVTSDVGPMPEVCGEHALYCDPYDHREIAAQMLRCLEMPIEEKAKRISAARAHAAGFTWKRCAGKMAATICELLDNTRVKKPL
ncbi:MAG: glycosyltransferase family 1 protein [Gemmataceae bacterium]|nr:glycosyltransferase family 1 protein [Gemmataceae bacterium]